jgi:alpha-glucosidase
VRGLMWDHPQDPHAFSEAHKYQFFLGRDFLVAPVYRSQAATQGWRRGIYLPQGVWYDYFDGRRASAGAQGRTLDMKVGLEKLPVFVRAGAIIPMQPPMLFDGEKPRDELTLDIYPHGHSHTTVYEDDGLTRAYQRGAFSEQRIEVKAPDATSGQPGPITISVQAAQGHYQGQLEQRRTRLMLRTRSAVSGVTLGGQTVPAVASLAALDALEPQASGWVYQSDERGGTLHVRSARHDIRQALNWVVQPGDVGMDVREGDFPAAPELGRAVPPDSLLVINRPLEESGHMLENAFDDKPQTWFRSSRNQAIKTGPVEFVVSLGERRLIDGLEFAPRTDQHWKYGQVGEFEVYLGDNNGDWGAPAYRGVLKHSKDAQTVNFAAKAGKLLRLRILSSLNPNTGQAGLNTDPMVLAVSAAAKPAQGQANGSVAMPRAYSATAHAGPEPITLSSLRILQQLPPAGEPRSLELAQLQGLGTVAVNRPAGHKQAGLRMNALAFRHGLSMKPGQSVKLALKGYWETLKADLGIDDQCRSPQAGVHFQVWGDARLLYDSGAVQDAAVVKPEIDLRGLSTLELRTLALPGRSVTGVCGNWANATLTGGPDSQAHPSR